MSLLRTNPNQPRERRPTFFDEDHCGGEEVPNWFIEHYCRGVSDFGNGIEYVPGINGNQALVELFRRIGIKTVNQLLAKFLENDNGERTETQLRKLFYDFVTRLCTGKTVFCVQREAITDCICRYAFEKNLASWQIYNSEF